MKKKKIVLRTSGTTIVVRCADITHCHASGSYTRIVLRRGEQYMTCKSLSKTMDEIAVPYIMRISQSVAVNVHYITNVRHLKREVDLVSGESLRYTVKRRVLDETIENVLNTLSHA